jgi:hypothetical protein
MKFMTHEFQSHIQISTEYFSRQLQTNPLIYGKINGKNISYISVLDIELWTKQEELPMGSTML